jgi:hypothetical protein
VAGKAFVPGLEVESLSYARVGPRNLARLRALGVPFAGVGAPPAGAAALPLMEGHPAAWLDVAAMDAAVGELYALQREPGRHVVAPAEERRPISKRMSDWRRGGALAGWCLSGGRNGPARKSRSRKRQRRIRFKRPRGQPRGRCAFHGPGGRERRERRCGLAAASLRERPGGGAAAWRPHR